MGCGTFSLSSPFGTGSRNEPQDLFFWFSMKLFFGYDLRFNVHVFTKEIGGDLCMWCISRLKRRAIQKFKRDESKKKKTWRKWCSFLLAYRRLARTRGRVDVWRKKKIQRLNDRSYNKKTIYHLKSKWQPFFPPSSNDKMCFFSPDAFTLVFFFSIKRKKISIISK